MHSINGSMKSQDTLMYVNMVSTLYTDLVSALVTEKEVRKDLETIRNRVSTEGLSFLTKTLPQLGKAVDRALSTDSVLDIPMFRKVHGTRIPHFMRRLLEYLFSNDGYPLQDAGSQNATSGLSSLCREAPTAVRQTHALKSIRQICYLFYKLQVPYTDSQTNEVIQAFVDTEDEIWDGIPRSSTERAVLTVARRLCHRVLNSADPFDGLPGHGPGAVSTGERADEKHLFRRWYDLLMEVFPYDRWFSVNAGGICDSYHRFGHWPSELTGTAKVVLVPKDSRGPRLISCEPLEYQWVQQAIKSIMMDTIESHPLTRGKVNFTDQEVNRRLALEGSATGKWATLDMKEASDRVSVHHVSELFPDRWCEALFASRSTHTKLPDGRVVHLKKMAPMGSAVCFPIESLVFWSLCVAGLVVTRGVPEHEALSQTHVYGDDIVIDSEYHAAIITTLESFGLKVNRQKCCTTGFFRESCGMDAYRGICVTPIRCKRPWNSRRSPDTLASWVALSNNLWVAGCWTTAEMLADCIKKQWGNTIPTTPDVIGCVSFVRPELPMDVPRHVPRRYNKRLQRMEIRGHTSRPSLVKTRHEGYPLLLRNLLEKEKRKGEFLAGAPTGTYPIAHRNKYSRAWTPCGIKPQGVIEKTH